MSTTEPKRAVIDWKKYQNQRASWTEVNAWVRAGYELAIVTGRVSNLVVLDFDHLPLWEQFKADLPGVVSSCLSVQTRRGVHLYVPVHGTGETIHGRAGAGWDLKADGGYVVAPYSVINEHLYAPSTSLVALHWQPQPGQLPLIINWLNAQQPSGPDDSSGELATEESDSFPTGGQRLPVGAAQGLYRSWAAKGRNNALFAVARLMHDHFYDEATAIEALADLHVAARPPEGHPEQWPTSRLNEAVQTIRSAYSRKRRPTRPVAARQLPNIVREHLNRAKLTAVARVLDALRSAGYGPGSLVTQGEISEALAGTGIGNWSVRKCFSWVFSLPKTHPDASLTTASHSDALPYAYRQEKEKTVVCLRDQNQRFMNPYYSDRRARLISLPSDEELAAQIGVNLNKSSDPVERSALRSVKFYRAALHSAFLKRRPGSHGIWWLAHRCGVSKVTLRRYNHIAQIIVEPRAQREFLTRALLAKLPNNDGYSDLYHNRAGKVRTPGYWLEDEAGKRYPALQVVAMILTKGKRPAWLCVRSRNYYKHASLTESIVVTDWPEAQQLPLLPDTPQIASNRPIEPSQRPAEARQPIAAQQRFTVRQKPSAAAPQRQQRPAKWRRQLPPHNPRLYKRDMENPRYEYVAQRIHESFPEIALSAARRVVHLCGGQAVYGALAVVAGRQERGSDAVRDAAKLFLTIAGYSTAVRKQKEEAKQHLYRVVYPRRRARWQRNEGAGL